MTLRPGDDRDGAVVTWIDRPAVPGPLNGLRIGIKDLIAVEGVSRLCGAPGMVDPTPCEQDAPAVARLAAAGAQIVATTATHEFGWGVVTPAVDNPRAPGRIAGGSSGGSAAALAAGLIDGALGTDTLGSIRIPAACCGVVGLKPSEGVVPREGVQPLAPSFDTVGPMARDVDTVTRLQAVLAGGPLAPALPSPLRVGVVRQVRDGPVDPEVRRAWDHVLAALRSEGGRLRDVSMDRVAQAHAAAVTIMAAEELTVHAATIEQHWDALSPGVRRAFERSRNVANDDVLSARRDVAMWRSSLKGTFEAADVLVLPVLPCRVPVVGAAAVDVEGEVETLGGALTRLTSPWSAAGTCAVAVPVARDSAGAPIGIQIVGAWGQEHVVLAVAALVERLCGAPWPPVGRNG